MDCIQLSYLFSLFTLEQLTVIFIKTLSLYFIVFPPVWIGMIFFFFYDQIHFNISARNSALLKLCSSLLAKQLCIQTLVCYKELNSNKKGGKKRKNKLQELLYAVDGSKKLPKRKRHPLGSQGTPLGERPRGDSCNS